MSVNTSIWKESLFLTCPSKSTCTVISRGHILPLRRRGHATLDDQHSNRDTENRVLMNRVGSMGVACSQWEYSALGHMQI